MKWFYSGIWSKAHDTAFINMLNVQAERGRKQHDPNNVNQYALNFASRVVTRGWHWEFRRKIYLWRLEWLRIHYMAFKSIMEHPEITRDQSSNFISEPAEVLETMRQVYVFFSVMPLICREPEWDELKMIFEPNEEAAVQEVYETSSGDKEHVQEEEQVRERTVHTYQAGMILMAGCSSPIAMTKVMELPQMLPMLLNYCQATMSENELHSNNCRSFYVMF
ncbi:hypothetical protein Salat_2141100 [Sesamum alatum]|uniref:Uncharacterized protein n=1 Tax=Sesamum alatum TaxID=300844 RepID=A0AAE1Y291_9LAMI|nr:hypothetical protein Salat_2141100 [Sesamum alatum]